MHSHSIMPRAPRQRATQNIDMAIEPEKGGKLAHERLQSALPVRAKTRRQTITPDGTPGPLCQSDSDRRQTAAIFFAWESEITVLWHCCLTGPTEVTIWGATGSQKDVLSA
jgi:hypothetical protein